MTKIETPGVYDIDFDTYLGDTCSGPSISATGINRLVNQCPALYWETSRLNPKRVAEEPRRALDVGKAAHALTLGEPEFARYFAVLPFDDLRTKEARAWRDKMEEDGKTVLRADDFATVQAMSAAMRRSPQVARAFQEGKAERSLIWQDAETGVYLKSRPDWLADDPGMQLTLEYKTCRTLDPRKLAQAFFDYGYHIQAALVLDGIQAVLGVTASVAHICQEKESPYLAECRMFTPEQINFGRQEYRRGLRIFRSCWDAWKAGRPDRIAWPGFTTEPTYLETPYYIERKMEDPLYGQDHGTRDPADYVAAD